MQKENKLFAKSDQINLCGVIGMALALIGLLLPSIRVSFMGMGESGTMFQMTMWTILPLLLIIGTCALFALKFDVLGFLAAILSAVVYFIVLVCCRAVGSREIGNYGVSIHFSFGFYLAFLGFMIAIAAPWINKLIFKAQPKRTVPQFDPNMPQGPGMNQPNPFMGQGQPQPGQFPNQGMNPGNPYMGQGMNPGNPYMNQGQAPVNPYMNQGQAPVNPYMNQGQPNPYMSQPNPHMNQANPYMNQANSYMDQAMDQAGQAMDQASQAVDQAAEQAEDLVQNADVPNGDQQ